MKGRLGIAIVLALVLSGLAFAQGSNRGTAEATVGGKKVSINYGRPSLKGRDMLGMMKEGMVWRLGMNQATEISSEGDLEVNGTEVKAGKYSLWLKKTGENEWTLEFHPKTGIWGLPVMTEGYVAGLPLKMTKASNSVEQLTITLTSSGDNCEVKIQWGTADLAGSFGVK